MRGGRRILIASVALIGLSASLSWAADYTEQRSQLGKVSSSLRTAERFARAERLEEATAAYVEADRLVREVAGDLHPRAVKLYERAAERLAEARVALVRAGANLPELPGPPTQGGGDAVGSGPQNGGPATGVSFVRQVAPMLAAKCGGCHIDSERGAFSLANYELLMRGSRVAGRVITPGDSRGSVIVDLIESGDMPRGGGRVTPAELQALTTWINEGAKFDGDGARTNLRELRPAGDAIPVMMTAERARPTLPMPTGNETVSFAADVAPILVANCVNCHIFDDRGGFRMSSFRQLLASGAVEPSDPASSTLALRVRGEEGRRMPLNSPPLTADEIRIIETWIAEGGAFDGQQLGEATTGDRLDRVASLATATRATGAELNQMRVDLSERHWRTALSDSAASTVETEQFLVMGALPEAQLRAIGEQAERAVDHAAETLNVKS
ncbi:MAG: c-type cytochrome domain-containing protein, partial [Planctomycetota bacterium]